MTNLDLRIETRIAAVDKVYLDDIAGELRANRRVWDHQVAEVIGALRLAWADRDKARAEVAALKARLREWETPAYEPDGSSTVVTGGGVLQKMQHIEHPKAPPVRRVKGDPGASYRPKVVRDAS